MDHQEEDEDPMMNAGDEEHDALVSVCTAEAYSNTFIITIMHLMSRFTLMLK